MKPIIETRSGRMVRPLHPEGLHPDDVDLEDIAHALAMKCRWTGHTATFYSVAEHAIHVATMVEMSLGPASALKALHHDDAEAYLPDVAAPIKDAIRVAVPGYTEPVSFCRVEQILLDSIMDALAIPRPTPAENAAIHFADLTLLVTEARDLMHGTEGWDRVNLPTPLPGIILRPWPCSQAKLLFLQLHRRLSSTQAET